MSWTGDNLFYVLLILAAFVLPLLPAVLPRKKQRIFASTMLPVIVFLILFSFLGMFLCLASMIFIPIFFNDNSSDNWVAIFLLVVSSLLLLAAGLSYRFVRRFVLGFNREQVEEIEKEEAEGRSNNSGDAQPETFRQRLRNFAFMLSPSLILFAGALFTRHYGHMLYSWIISVAAALAVLEIISRRGWYRTRDSSLEWSSLHTAALVIPTAMTYLLFIVILFGADLKAIKNLF